MKKFFTHIGRLALLLFIITPIFAGSVIDSKPAYDKVYRTDKISDSYYFLVLSKDGSYYHLNTNKTDSLTANELKSPNILNILKDKRSWGQAFLSKGKYTTKKDKLYTKRYWDRIKVISSKKIKLF